VLLCLVTLIQQTLWNGFDLGVFGGFHGKVSLKVDFRFLLNEWVLGTELLAKGSARGTPTIRKVSLWSVERIGRSIGRRVEFFPCALFFPTVQAKTGLTGFPNWSDRFRLVGCREGFLSKEVSVALWLLLFMCRKALEVVWVFGEFLNKVGLTGLPNRSDRFPLPVWG
jgi:hypothetical protein